VRNLLLLFLLALPCAACAELDPQFGTLRPEDEETQPSSSSGTGGAVSFATDIRPLMDRLPDDPAGPGCRKCHYTTEPTHVGLDLGGLDLTTLGSLRKGGATSGSKIIVAGSPAESVIVQKLHGTYPFGERMPRSGPPYLSGDEILLFEQWIAEGANGADDE